MSILSDAAGAPLQQKLEQIFFVIVLSLTAVAIVLAWRLRVYRPKAINGPSRIADNEPIGFLLLVMGAAVMALIVAQMFCLFATMGNAASTTKPTTVATTDTIIVEKSIVTKLTPWQMALSVSVPSLVAFLVMLIANTTIRSRGLTELGLSRSHFRRGVLTGLLGSVIALPLTHLAAAAMEMTWKQLHYEHPTEHDLLRVLGEHNSPVVTLLLILSATLIAPLFEEALFRGHLQTALTHGFSRISQWRKRRVVRGFDVILPGGEVGHVTLPPERVPFDPPTVSMRWLSVLLTSVLFALVHPLWMTPPIFVLAICLGYAYERTGNLWTTITMHAMFNTTSTVLFLFVMH